MDIIDNEVLLERLSVADARKVRMYLANARNLDRYGRQQAALGYDCTALLCTRDADICRLRAEELLLSALQVAHIPFRGRVS
ncbi:hypothetical protein [Komagataeibacter sp. FNDCR2]|uniref:hypothetical protein n=1 Tax=Komagataeibacter sp. FNDCR2 TaxID=2878682 RepID=UPI001E60C278|nr:hypothetical protein [Komagataeibacter sp. FNDCR2]MCE2576053.1 hypothetical protein [Komagataeibacter sp. FNDCR2]